MTMTIRYEQAYDSFWHDDIRLYIDFKMEKDSKLFNKEIEEGIWNHASEDLKGHCHRTS